MIPCFARWGLHFCIRKRGHKGPHYCCRAGGYKEDVT